MTMTPVALFGTRPETAIANIRGRSGKDSSNAGDGRKLGLIIEGGAMRGIFSCGGGIALELLGLSRAFDEVYACSSGAINAAYFVAGQAAYSVSIYYDEVNNRNFINPLRLNNILNMDFLFDEVIKRRKPLDVERVLSSPSKLRISITDANTGAGFLIDAQNSRYALLDSLSASSIAKGENPMPPQLATDGVEDDPESWTFWKVKHGIRWTGMPAWKDGLNDDQIWTLALFLKHMDKLPPVAAAKWHALGHAGGG